MIINLTVLDVNLELYDGVLYNLPRCNIVVYLVTRIDTAREMDISTGPEPPVSTGRAPGTTWSVLNVFAFSTGQNARY